MQDSHLLDNLQIFSREHTPRRNRELHHRHEGVHLCGTHDERLVELVGVDTEEGCPLSTTNHVGANIGIAQQARCGHTWDEGLHCFPAIVLIAKALYERLTAHLPASTVLVEWELQTDLCPRGGMIDCGSGLVVCEDRSRSIAVVVACVELIAIDAIVGLYLLEDTNEMRYSIGVGEVVASRIAVPPVEHSSAAMRVLQQIALGRKVAVLWRVGRHEWAYPQHNLEAQCVEFVHHGFRVEETLGFEVEVAIVALPIVVNHQYTRREAFINNRMCIAEDIGLVLVVHEFDPCVVLRHGEEEGVRQSACSWEILSLRCHIGIAKGSSCLYLGHWDRGSEFTILHREDEGGV